MGRTRNPRLGRGSRRASRVRPDPLDAAKRQKVESLGRDSVLPGAPMNDFASTYRAQGLLNVAVGNERGNSSSVGALNALREGAGVSSIPGQVGFSKVDSDRRKDIEARMANGELRKSDVNGLLDKAHPVAPEPRLPSRGYPIEGSPGGKEPLINVQGAPGRKDIRGVDPETRAGFNRTASARRRNLPGGRRNLHNPVGGLR